MYTLCIESRLVGALSKNVTVEVSPREKIGNIVTNYLCSMPGFDEASGLAIYNEKNYKLDWNATFESQGIKEGSKLFLGYDEKSEFLKTTHVAVISLSTIIIAVVLFISVAVLFATTGGNISHDYGVVIDAGSTHTKVFLYHWLGEKEQGTGNVHQKNSCKYEVGIASDIDPSNIVKCVNNVSSLVPTGTLPVLYLGATAGMRILNITNPKEASLILTSLKYALSTCKVQLKAVNIIKGKEEAISSLISTNFLTHTLKNPKERSTYGALDLGGASTQYAFAVYNESFTNRTNITSLQLYGNQFLVQSESFLCYGYSEAMSRHESLMFMNKESVMLFDPCLPTGYKEEIDGYSFSKKPCINNHKFDIWLKKNSMPGNLMVKGAGNYSQCKESIQNLMNNSLCEASGFKPCMPTINLKKLNMDFMAFSGFYYVVHYLNGTNSLEEFINSTIDWCSLTWEEIQYTQPKSQLQHVSRYCFIATYITELVTKKYGFDSITWKRIKFALKIDDSEIGWTLGYMIKATNDIPAQLPSPPVISLIIFIPLTIICIAMIIVAVIIIKKYADIRLFNKYKRLFKT